MYSLLYRLYIWVFSLNENQIVPKVLRMTYGRFFFYFCNFFMVGYYSLFKCNRGLNTAKRRKKLIVSLTSYPKRTGTIWITLESLLRQRVRPDIIFLWLADDQFPNHELPKKLSQLEECGITIRWCDNLMSHKKYFYAMQEYPDANIITADDDSFYPPFFIERLLKMHEKYPNDVVCLTAQSMGDNYRVVPSHWPGVSKEEIISSYSISINSGSGALFPPHSISPKAFDKDAIQSLCPYADDLWLTVMAHINGTKISKYKYHPFPVVIKSTLSDSLAVSYNGPQAKSEINNDTQWDNMMKQYHADIKSFVGDYF